MTTFNRLTFLALACAMLAAPVARAGVFAQEAAKLKTTLAQALNDRNFVSLLARRTF